MQHGPIVKGEAVVIPFPFSDLSQAKRRPALDIASLTGNDLILCMITSQFTRDVDAIALHNADFTRGSFNQDSYIRPNRLFTASEAIVVRGVGQISDTVMWQVVEKFIEIVSR